MAFLIAKKTDYKGQILWDKSMPDGTPKKLLDISRLSKLGWKPNINLEKGIEMTIESFKKKSNQEFAEFNFVKIHLDLKLPIAIHPYTFVQYF